ncbi:MAG TPA: right-handed parallel beta-helix repeat-containing protein [Lysobacter sp.]
MLPLRHLTAAMLLLACLIATPLTVRAETYHTCTGFIDTLPATITTQGVWCLRHDLSTAVTSGAAITINTNNVTIDCNDFKVGGLAAGAGTLTYGIFALNRLNATVRHCNIRGFRRGLSFDGSAGGGHVVEDSRFDGNTWIGIRVEGEGSVVRRNQVTDTGGGGAALVYGIIAYYTVDVLDNTVSGVVPDSGGDGSAYGIYTSINSNGSVSGNRVRGLYNFGDGAIYGIYTENSGRISLVANQVAGSNSANSIGLRCSTDFGSTKDNIINGFATGISICTNNGGNVIKP